MFSLKKFKYLLCLLIVISMTLVVGCSSGKKANSQTKKKVKFVDDTHKLLVNGGWNHFDPIDSLGIAFCENGEFYYCCGCGEPVGDSDIYDMYEYKKGGKIKLFSTCLKNKSKNIKIIHIDEKCLLIKLDGEVIEFYNEENTEDISLHTNDEGCEKCNPPLDKYSGFNKVIDINKDDNKMAIAPSDYDKDEEQKEYLRDVKLAKNVEIYKLDVYSEIDDAGMLAKHKCSYKKVDDKELDKIIEKFSSSALINYNKEGKVKKIVFYKKKLKESL